MAEKEVTQGTGADTCGGANEGRTIYVADSPVSDLELDWSEGELMIVSSEEENESVKVEIVDTTSSEDGKKDLDCEAKIELYSSSSEEDKTKTNVLAAAASKDVQQEEVVYPCAYRKYGCGRSFLEALDFKEHVLKHCKYSILHACQENGCRGTSNARFDTFEDLMKHCIENHDIPDMIAQNGISTFIVTPEFFEARMQGVWLVPDVNAKVIGHGIIKENGEEYRLAFLLVSSWRGIQDDRVYLAPVMYGQGDHMDHCVEVKFSVGGSGGGFLKVRSGLVEASSTITMCHAIGNIKKFYDLMNTLDVVTFEKKHFMDKGRVNPNGKLSYDLLLEINFYRVRILRQSGMEPKKYALTKGQLNGKVEFENPSTMTKVVTPQLYGDADLMIESHDQAGLFATFYSALMSYALTKRMETGTEARKCIGIVLFPTSTLLNNAEKTWKEKGTLFGVSVTSLPDLNGSEILLGTPTYLLDALNQEKSVLTDAYVSRLKFVVIFDADHYFVHSNASLLKKSMSRIRQMVTKNIVRVAISPVVNEDLISLLNSHGFTYSSNVFSIGNKPDLAISNMAIEFGFENRFPFKRQAVLPILRSHMKEPNRWIIFAEHLDRCEDNLKELLCDLTAAYDRVTTVASQEEMELNPAAFESFLGNPKAVLLTGYFALAKTSILVGCNVLMYTMPSCKADLRRVADLVLNGGKRTHCYGLRDRNSRDVMSERDLFD